MRTHLIRLSADNHAASDVERIFRAKNAVAVVEE